MAGRKGIFGLILGPVMEDNLRRSLIILEVHGQYF